MISAWVAGATSTYAYDHTIARMAQRTSTTTSHYPNKFYSIDYAGSSTTTATSTAYIWHGDTLVAYIEQRIASGQATGTPTTYYVHPDHLGSTNVVTNASGTVAETLDYYPYGAERIHTGTADLDRTFIGQFGDDPSALSYLNARYYDPARGQFTSQDPTHLVVGDPSATKTITGVSLQQLLAEPQALNSYSYAKNNPVVSKDPEGTFAFAIPVIATAPLWAPLVAGSIAAGAYIVSDIALRNADRLREVPFDTRRLPPSWMMGPQSPMDVKPPNLDGAGKWIVGITATTYAADALNAFVEPLKHLEEWLKRQKELQQHSDGTSHRSSSPPGHNNARPNSTPSEPV